MEHVAQFIFFLNMGATAVMAASAALQAARMEFDLFGAIVLSLATACGGGTLRDLLIGRTPVFWLNDLSFLACAVPVSAVVFWRFREVGRREGKRLAWLLYLDAIGLGLFALTGTRIGVVAGVSDVAAVILGCITGIAGGMVRDIMCGITPSVLREDLYATIALGGSAIYIMLTRWISNELALLAAFIVMIAVRFLVIRRALNLPRGKA